MKKLGFILIGLLIVRLLIPPVALSVLNRLLDKKMGVYFGHIQDLDLSLYRGAVCGDVWLPPDHLSTVWLVANQVPRLGHPDA